jgi:outer membrane protein TolC
MLPPAKPTGTALAKNSHDTKDVPLTLDTILRLAESHNARVGLARARVAEACAANCLASKNWLPNLYVGTTYYRHEGGISLEDGTLLHSSFGVLFGGIDINSKLDIRELTYQRIVAERSFWQEKAELSQVTYETLVDATATYIDMVSARTAELIALDIEKELQNLLPQTEKLAEAEPAARVVAARVRAFLAGLKQVVVHSREDFARASAKLTYLLGLDPCSTLVPLDEKLVALDLVDANVPCCQLVSQVWASGPGVHELERILALAHEAVEKSNGPGHFLPVFETRMLEGGYGTGPGDSLSWDNRWDFGVQVRWNLTDLLTRSERQRIIHAKAAQAHFANDDLKSKLAASVEEARESILFGQQKIELDKDYVEKAREVNRLANQRMMNMYGQAGVHDEVLLSLENLGVAQRSYVNALRDYDKAELRLLILLGMPGPLHPEAGANCPTPAQPRQ